MEFTQHEALALNISLETFEEFLNEHHRGVMSEYSFLFLKRDKLCLVIFFFICLLAAAHKWCKSRMQNDSGTFHKLVVIFQRDSSSISFGLLTEINISLPISAITFCIDGNDIKLLYLMSIYTSNSLRWVICSFANISVPSTFVEKLSLINNTVFQYKLQRGVFIFNRQ